MKILICGHSNYGECAFSTLKFFKNDIEKDVSFINDDVDFPRKVSEFFSKNKMDEILVLTDLLGGSPNAYFMEMVKCHPNMRLISGLNVAGMLELLFKEEMHEDELNLLIEEAQNGLVYVNDFFEDKS